MPSKFIIAVVILFATFWPAARSPAAEDKVTFSKCMDMAEQIASRLTPGRAKDLALHKIIWAYARAGLFAPITAIDNEILDHHLQIQSLLDAVNASGATGNNATENNKSGAATLLQRALVLVAANPDAASRDNLLWQIAGQLTEIGQVDQARGATKLIESLSNYDHALYEIAAAQAHQHDLAGATATANSMRPDSWREQAFAVIAEFATHDEDTSRADNALTQSRQHSDSALGAMAWEKSAGHDFRAALELARQIVNPGVREGAMQKVGEDAAAAGALDVAVAAFREAHANARQTESGFALAYIATAQAKAALFDDAMATVDDLAKLPIQHRSVMNGNDLVFALGNIAKEQARSGRLADARHTLDRARQSLLGVGGSSSVGLVSDAMEIGEIAWAREVANELPAFPRLRALQRIAVGLAKREDFDGAAATLADIERLQDQHDHFADDLRQEIAVEQIRHGRVVDAFETASQVQDSEYQVFALSEMAAAAVGR
jgi:hypothetical protein